MGRRVGVIKPIGHSPIPQRWVQSRPRTTDLTMDTPRTNRPGTFGSGHPARIKSAKEPHPKVMDHHNLCRSRDCGSPSPRWISTWNEAWTRPGHVPPHSTFPSHLKSRGRISPEAPPVTPPTGLFLTADEFDAKRTPLLQTSERHGIGARPCRQPSSLPSGRSPQGAPGAPTDRNPGVRQSDPMGGPEEAPRRIPG